MGSVYRRKDSKLWWIAFLDETGKRKLLSSGSEDEDFAKKLLTSCERKVAAIRNAGVATEAMPTVSAYAEKWLEQRVRRGFATAKDDRTRLTKHALPHIGALRMDEVRRKHLRAMMVELEVAGRLAPRTRRHVYYALKRMFSDAVKDELIAATPCTLTEADGEIPPKRDADLGWRRTAVFSREEIAALLSDPRIPWVRRTLYAIEFLAGMRINEIAPRRWCDWQRAERPLSKLLVDSTYQPKLKKLKQGTKTGVAREVPVHPLLAELLAAWFERGWEAFEGRPPKQEDVIVPRTQGEGFMSSSSAWKRLQEDLALLGFRGRRQHDARRTFISLARADGAFPDKLKLATHGAGKEIMDLYTSLPWDALCAEVAKLKITLPGPATPLLRPTQQPGKTDEKPWRRRESKARPAPRSSPHSPAMRNATEGSEGRSLPGVTQRTAPTVADVADPGGYEALARRQGFYVSPPPSQIH